MLRFTRATIVNIRSIDHLTVAFDAAGTTAIVGASGAGKSTILDGITWAGWGEIRGGLVQAEARRDTADPAAECYVEFEAECSGSTIRVKRSLRRSMRGGKPTEVAKGQLWINGAEQDNITASTLTAKMRDLTGKSALYTFLQRINELLVRWACRKFKRFRRRPRRARVFLAGIARREPALFGHWVIGIKPSGSTMGAV